MSSPSPSLTEATPTTTATATPKTDTTTTETPKAPESSSFDEIKVVFQDTQNVLKNYIVIIVIAFLAIFMLLRIFGGQDTILGSWVSNMIDLFVLVVLFTWIGYDFIFTYSGEDRESAIMQAYNYFKSYVNDSYSILYTGLFIAVFYTLVYAFGVPMSPETRSVFIGIVDNGAWLLFIISLIVWILKTFFGFDLFKESKEEPKEEESKEEEPKKEEQITQDEVFNIGNNKYTYEDAQGICKSYGARLATYDEIEAAYNKGAEWCNYGWSEGQMAYFPTQKATWSELQKDEKRKNDCGRPGINGGYMANPYIRFGVNCYGKKPSPTPSELAKMQVRKENVVPKTKEDVILDMKVKFWKENADKLLNINAFNSNKWSQY